MMFEWTGDSMELKLRRFLLMRTRDVTGVSGEGIVAQGVEFEDGTVAMRWCVKDAPNSTVIWEDTLSAMKVHGHGGATTLEWVD